MKKYLTIFFFTLFIYNTYASIENNIINFYIYPIEKTPLNLILDKSFLLNKLKNIKGKNIKKNLIDFSFTENENEISLFFDKKSYNLIGWQTTDIYQNSNTTVLSSIDKNINLTKNLFRLPKQD